MIGRQQGKEFALAGRVANGPGGVLENGLAGWLLRFWRRTSERRAPQLELIERISLGPRQALALIEAEGTRVLVATSADGAAAFFPLGDAVGSAHGRRSFTASPRVSDRTSRSWPVNRVSRNWVSRNRISW